MWLTEEWSNYWCDVYGGKYSTGEQPTWLSRPTVIRAEQKPAPVRPYPIRVPRHPVITFPTPEFPDYGKMFADAARATLERFAREVGEAASLKHIAALGRNSYIRRINQILQP